MENKRMPILYAILAAACYGVSAPVAKLLLDDVPPMMMAAALYLGAGAGMCLLNLLRPKKTRRKEARVTKRELPFTAAMVGLRQFSSLLRGSW